MQTSNVHNVMQLVFLYLILHFGNRPPSSPVYGIREVSITDRSVVFELITAVLSVEDRRVDVGFVVLNTHVELMVLL